MLQIITTSLKHSEAKKVLIREILAVNWTSCIKSPKKDLVLAFFTWNSKRVPKILTFDPGAGSRSNLGQTTQKKM